MAYNIFTLCVFVYICMYVRVCIYACMCVCACVYVRVCMRVCMCVYSKNMPSKIILYNLRMAEGTKCLNAIRNYST